ncbi:MAG: hypothetical protein U0176_05315 [Bacteroidia bacterium]
MGAEASVDSLIALLYRGCLAFPPHYELTVRAMQYTYCRSPAHIHAVDLLELEADGGCDFTSGCHRLNPTMAKSPHHGDHYPQLKATPPNHEGHGHPSTKATGITSPKP